jgi:hypothetical protein
MWAEGIAIANKYPTLTDAWNPRVEEPLSLLPENGF